MRELRRQQSEHGSAIIAAILMMVIIGGLVAMMTMLAQQASTRSGDSARRVANKATVQTALTRITYGLQANLGSEQDYFRLDMNDLRAITERTGSSAQVFNPNAGALTNLPNDYKSTGGVWEHRASPHRLARVEDANGVAVQVPAFIVEEPAVPDAGACTGAGLAASVCAAGNVRSYWQVYRLVLQDTTGNSSPVIGVVVRSWLGDRSQGIWSKASYARADLRAGRFADYQQISDGNVYVASGSRINGPLHSNGLADGSFSTVHSAPTSATGGNPRWIYLESGVNCAGDNSLSITQGVIVGPGASGCNVRGQNGQTISFLRAVNSIDTIRQAAQAGQPNVRSFTFGGGTSGAVEPIETAWTVRLQGNQMKVWRPNGNQAPTQTLGRSNAYVFDRDVRVQGHVGVDKRVTIAASRGGAAASIFIDGNLTKDHAKSTSIGLIAHGDIVFWQQPSQPCAVRRVEAAMVAATGGVTIPTKYTTPERQQNAPVCGSSLTINGTVAGHRPPTMTWSWPPAGAFGAKDTGYNGNRNYRWDEALKNNPPPYFPLTGTWQTVLMTEANTDCLFSTTKQTDPECR